MKGLIPTLVAAVLVSACANPLDAPLTTVDALQPQLAMVNTSTGYPQGDVNAVTPSTNAVNTTNGWAHVAFVDDAVLQVTLDFISTRGFYSCFEYRIDDEGPTSSNNGGVNYNPAVTDGLWNYTCQNNSTAQMTFNAADHVDVRMVFGAETDERFDWTRFYVVPLDNADQCKNGAWEALGFKNQGQCVRYVETGKDSRTGG